MNRRQHALPCHLALKHQPGGNTARDAYGLRHDAVAAARLALARGHHRGSVLDALPLHHAGLVRLGVLMQLELVSHHYEVAIVLIECQVLLHHGREGCEVALCLRHGFI